MKLLLSLLLTLYISCAPALAAKPYVAVFASMDFYEEDWNAFKPDYALHAPTWEALEPFLRDVKKKAGNREIVIDIQTHGNTSGALALAWGKVDLDWIYSEASMGYVANRINKVFPEGVKVVLIEACFGGYVYGKSMNPKPSNNRYMESCYNPPRCPMYGLTGKYPNYNNLVFLQWLTGFQPDFVDLRTNKPPASVVPSSDPDYEKNRKYWRLLKSLHNSRN